MMARMSAVEFDHWLVYASLGSFGEARMDARFGILAAALANRLEAIGGVKHPKNAPESFIPWRAEPEPDIETPEETFARMRTAFAALAPVIDGGARGDDQ